MPMDKEEYENLLTELLNADLEQSRRTEILQLLRTDYNTVHNDFSELTASNEKLTAKNDDLVHANSMLFRKAGIEGSPERKQEEEKKTFSETITIEDIEKGM